MSFKYKKIGGNRVKMYTLRCLICNTMFEATIRKDPTCNFACWKKLQRALAEQFNIPGLNARVAGQD